jgi:hypothetical protein
MAEVSSVIARLRADLSSFNRAFSDASRAGRPGLPQSPATNTSLSKWTSTLGFWAPSVNPGTWRRR